MTTTTTPRATTWQTTPPPLDRQIVISGNISYSSENGTFSDVFPFTTRAEWNPEISEWVGNDGLTLTHYVDDTLHIHQWIDLPESGKSTVAC